MVAKPSTTPRWASTLSPGADLVEPASGKKDIGWVENEQPPYEYFNWLGQTTYLWTEWLDDSITDDNTLFSVNRNRFRVLRQASTDFMVFDDTGFKVSTFLASLGADQIRLNNRNTGHNGSGTISLQRSDVTLSTIYADSTIGTIIDDPISSNTYISGVRAASQTRNVFSLFSDGTNGNNLEIGANPTANSLVFVDLISDTTFSDFGLRVFRNGTTVSSGMQHRGTGNFEIRAEEAAPLVFFTTATERARITDSFIQSSVNIMRAGAQTYYSDPSRITTGNDNGTATNFHIVALDDPAAVTVFTNGANISHSRLPLVMPRGGTLDTVTFNGTLQGIGFQDWQFRLYRFDAAGGFQLGSTQDLTLTAGGPFVLTFSSLSHPIDIDSVYFIEITNGGSLDEFEITSPIAVTVTSPVIDGWRV